MTGEMVVAYDHEGVVRMHSARLSGYLDPCRQELDREVAS